MSFIANWFWSKKPIEKCEQEKLRELHQSIFKELKEVFTEWNLTTYAERKYDYDEVYDMLTLKMHNVDSCYDGAVLKDGLWVFASDAKRKECQKAGEDYLDSLIEFREFFNDHPILKVPVAQRIFRFANNERFFYGGQYWLLFRRNLKEDLLNQEEVLEIIEANIENDEDSESWGENE